LGSGYYGTTFKIKIDDDDKLYALKRQNISKEEYEWISSLPTSDRIFFMELYEYKRFECDFQSIKSNEGKFCQDTIIELKGDTMAKKSICLVKTSSYLYFVKSLMHMAKYHHRDVKISIRF
jgi:hypothetical protein